MKILLIVMLSTVLFCSYSHARNTDQVLQELDAMIAGTTDPVKLSNLYTFKARNYRNSGKSDLSIKSYLQALKQHQKGGVWAELGSMYFKAGSYNKSAKVASKIINSFPAQKKYGLALLEKSNNKLEEIFLKENPPTIIINSSVRGKLTRFDYIRAAQQYDAAMGIQRFSHVESNKRHRKQKRLQDIKPPQSIGDIPRYNRERQALLDDRRIAGKGANPSGKRVQDIAPPKSIGDIVRYKRERQALLDDRRIAGKGAKPSGKRVQGIAPPKSIGDMVRYKRERQEILKENGIETSKIKVPKPPTSVRYQIKDMHGVIRWSDTKYQTKDMHGVIRWTQ